MDVSEEKWPEITNRIQTMQWETLASIAGHGFQNMTYEFYANAWYEGDEEWPEYVSYVRGKEVPFDAATISRILGIEEPEGEPDDTEFGQYLQDGEPDYAEMLGTLCVPGAHFKHSSVTKSPKSLRVVNLKPIPKAWCMFILGSMMPSVNDTELFLGRAKLLYGIMIGMTMNVGHIICQHITDVIVSKSSSLPFPSLIFLMCMEAGVDVEKGDMPLAARKSISDARVDKFRLQYEKRAGQPLPPSPPQNPRKAKMEDDHAKALFASIGVLDRNFKRAIAGMLRGVLHNIQRIEDLVLNSRGGRQMRVPLPLNYHQILDQMELEDLPPNPFEQQEGDADDAEDTESDEMHPEE